MYIPEGGTRRNSTEILPDVGLLNRKSNIKLVLCKKILVSTFL
jgi:hypothetical protein